MAINIPQSLWDKYYEAADLFINDNHIGRLCRVVYPPKHAECTNCVVSLSGSSTSNTYKHGGPAPFNIGSCPLCGGNGYTQQEYTDTLRLRIYWTKKDMARIAAFNKAGGASIPDGVVLVIGFMSDIQKIRQATEILLVSENTVEEYRFKLESEPYPHGFGKSRYFAAYLKRT